MAGPGGLIEYRGTRGKRFRIRYRDGSGKRVIDTLPAGTSKTEAKQILASRTVDVQRSGRRKADTKTTFKTYAERWLPAYVETEKLRKSTEAGYGVIVRILVAEFGSLKVSAVTPAKIREAMGRWTAKGSSGRTVNSRLAVLSIIFRDAVADSLIATNPVASVRRAKVRRNVERPLSPAEVGRMVAAFDSIIADEDADKRDDAIVSRMIFLFAVETGARKGEILGLKWKSVKLADPVTPHVEISESRVVGQVGPPKSEAGKRKIAIDGSIADALFEHRAWSAYGGEEELVFPNPRKGTAFDAMVYSAHFKTALAAADIDASSFRPFHGLRRTSLTNAAAAGVHSSALQTRAGHSSYAMTQEYVSLADQTFADETAKAGARMWGAA
ncbi:MAG: tyrosine-type recombinase/integrase [Actinobacteria bacterium]|nr:tyrosine-type recombinase/integrase [Actinomycetota bacterium]